MATTIGADLAVLRHPDFAASTHSTNWVAEHLDLGAVGSDAAGEAPTAPSDGEDAPRVRRDIDVEVDGKRFSVSMWVPDSAGGSPGAPARPRRARSPAAAGGGDGQVTVGMQGTIVKVLVAVGDVVSAGDPVVVLEAMKMENHVTADSSGTVTEVRVAVGDSVGAGDVVAVIG